MLLRQAEEACQEPGLNKSSVSFNEVTRQEIAPFVKEHYLGAWPSTAQLYVGVFYGDALVGMLIYGSPTAGNCIISSIFRAKKSGPRTWQCGDHKGHGVLDLQNISELKRLFLTSNEQLLPPSARKNLASYAIVNGNKLVARTRPSVKVIVTYSDSLFHRGTVYAATNAIYQGQRDGKRRWIYPQGAKSQKRWIRNHLKPFVGHT
jgi:hypothetical protein